MSVEDVRQEEERMQAEAYHKTARMYKEVKKYGKTSPHDEDNCYYKRCVWHDKEDK